MFVCDLDVDERSINIVSKYQSLSMQHCVSNISVFHIYSISFLLESCRKLNFTLIVSHIKNLYRLCRN